MFQRVKKQFTTCGLEPKVHGNVRATSTAKRFDIATVIRVKTFIENYAKQFGLILPGRVPAFNNPNLMILPVLAQKLNYTVSTRVHVKIVVNPWSLKHSFGELGQNSC